MLILGDEQYEAIYEKQYVTRTEQSISTALKIANI